MKLRTSEEMRTLGVTTLSLFKLFMQSAA